MCRVLPKAAVVLLGTNGFKVEVQRSFRSMTEMRSGGNLVPVILKLRCSVTVIIRLRCL